MSDSSTATNRSGSPLKPVRAHHFVRKMRGGAQSHMISGDDGALYVVKFSNNPQHRRILINEWIACTFLRYLNIFVPETALIQVTDAFIEQNPEVYFVAGSRRYLPVSGLHFGSKVAVDPNKVAIFDLLPEQLLAKVENRTAFLGTLAFDKWVGNTDSRQAVFFRGRAGASTLLAGRVTGRFGFFAQMIDHGGAFDGPSWEFQDTPLNGLYYRKSVYNEVTSLDSFEPWLHMLQTFPGENINGLRDELPQEWLAEDEKKLQKLLEQLMTRTSRLKGLIEDMRRKRPDAFPNWR